MKHTNTSSRIALLASAVLLFASAAFALADNNQGIKANKPGGPNLGGGIAGAGIDQETIRDRFARQFPGGGLLDIEGSLRRVYGVTFSTGATPSDSADKFMREWSMLWKVPYTQLEKVGPFEDGAHTLELMAADDGESNLFTAAYFRQQVSGVPVFRSLVWGLVRNEDNFPMVLAGATLRDIGNMEERLAGVDLDVAHIDLAVAASQVFGQFDAPPEMTTPRFVIWAGVDEDVQASRLAVEFIASGGQAMNRQKLLCVVDPANGNILFQESMIYSGSVSGQVNEFVTTDFRADACSAEVVRGMPYAKVVIGSTTFYADVNGAFSGTYSGSGSVVVAPTLAGKYFRVVEQSGSLGTVASQSLPNGGSGTFLFNPAPNATNTAQTNAYEMANRARDIIVAAAPSYPTIAAQVNFPINTNIADTCNAYYDGVSINFYSAGGGCNNTAFGDVVAHEYGHHMVQVAGSGQSQYGEGMGDCLGVCVTDASSLGVGFQTCSSGIRTASNTCQYSSSSCSSCGSEIHACGQLISGCVWSLRNSFVSTYPSDYRTRLQKLVVNSTPLHAGSSTIQNDITIDYLTLNDNNGNIGDGTPDYNAIAAAFNAHGLTAPGLTLLAITLPGGTLSTLNPSGGDTIAVDIAPVMSAVLAGSQKMFYREGTTGSFTAVPLASLGGTSYLATFPPTGCNATVQYYFEAKSTGGTPIDMPATAPTSNYSALSVLSSTLLFTDSFDGASTTMTVGAPGDTASAGMWVRAATTSGCGASAIAYSGAKAFLTGTGSCIDVDNGKTSLISPSVSGLGADHLDLKFALYLSYNGATPTDDPVEVFVSNDGGANWVLADSINVGQGWGVKTINVLDFVSASGDMKAKFVAQDNGTDNVVEVAIDSVSFTKVNCYPAIFGDLDGDGIVDGGDLGLLLLDFGPCSGCPGDLNGDGEVDGADIGLMLLAFT
ncbi:MAG: hypothetical protein K8R92_12410 [Planctomycetes bacterium]|nr:hypothetical protein [Planctomycetota bacterium]